MKRKPIVVTVLFIFLLSACGMAAVSPLKTNHTAKTTPMQTENYCTVVSSAQSSPDPTDAALNALVPDVNSNDWVEGPASADVTFLEYGDFQ
jgi:hypothetical protein